MTTLAARLAPLLPDRLVASTARLVYPRVEPELARLDELCPPGCGTAVDVGGWYGPWTRRLARRARHVVTVEPGQDSPVRESCLKLLTHDLMLLAT